MKQVLIRVAKESTGWAGVLEMMGNSRVNPQGHMIQFAVYRRGIIPCMNCLTKGLKKLYPVPEDNYNLITVK